MAEWLYERGIGENRAILIKGERIVAAEVERDDDGAAVGAVLPARLLAHDAPRRRARVRLADGREAWLSNPPAALTEGGAVLVRITRAALLEAGRAKLALAAPAASQEGTAAGPDLLARISETGIPVRQVDPRGETDWFENAGWSELLDMARTGHWPFAGGALAISLTPAMTVIDVDGDLKPEALAEAGAMAVTAAVCALGIRGSIGVDFPTLAGRSARQRVDALLASGLADLGHERTAMNGFGFVQIVTRRERPSLLERMQFDGAASDAAALLRRAERAVGTGPLSVRASAAVIGYIRARPQWIEQLGLRTGRAVVLDVDLEAKGIGHAQ